MPSADFHLRVPASMIPYDIASNRQPVARLPDGLELRACLEPTDPLLVDFFDGYDRSFVLPNEKEEIDGFRDCLALNVSPAYEQLAARYGPFREFVAVVVDTVRVPAVIVGGANFICYPLIAETGDPLLAMNLNYVFVLPEHRRHGYFGRILTGCEQLARSAFVPRGEAPNPDGLPLLMFMELNDPLCLDPADYAIDTAHSGLDQLQRIRIWAKAGAAIIDLPYVQPPLSETQAADHNLLLAVRGATGTKLSACLLRDHLERFFAISVLKGADSRQSPETVRQVKLLNDMCAQGACLALMDPIPYLDSPEIQSTASQPVRQDGNLRNALRNYSATAVRGGK